MWGDPYYGGDSSEVEQLQNIREIQATKGAFAAILADGSVVTWGSASATNGNFFGVQHQLRSARKIQAADNAFAAILSNETIVTWGVQSMELSFAAPHHLQSVQQIQASDAAFAAILSDGSVGTWGHPNRGGFSPTPAL